MKRRDLFQAPHRARNGTGLPGPGVGRGHPCCLLMGRVKQSSPKTHCSDPKTQKLALASVGAGQLDRVRNSGVFVRGSTLGCCCSCFWLAEPPPLGGGSVASQVLGTPCPWVWLSGPTAHRPSCVPFFRSRDFSFVTAGLAELTLRPHQQGGLGLCPTPLQVPCSSSSPWPRILCGRLPKWAEPLLQSLGAQKEGGFKSRGILSRRHL